MREFDVSELSREALEQTYEIVLIQKLALGRKIERLIKEMSVAACAFKDGVATVEDAENGLMNLIAYCTAKIQLDDEFNDKLGSIDLVNKHLEEIKEYEIERLEMRKQEKKKIKKSYMVYTDESYELNKMNVFCSGKKYLSEKQFNAENDKNWKVLAKLVDCSTFEPEDYLRANLNLAEIL